MDGIGLDQSQVADAINRKYTGMSQRERNQKMAQANAGGSTKFTSDYSTELAQAEQPTEFWGAGRKLAENQTPDMSAVAAGGGYLSTLGGDQYYYGSKDPSKYSFGNSTDLWSSLSNEYKNKYTPTTTQKLSNDYNNWASMDSAAAEAAVGAGRLQKYQDAYKYKDNVYDTYDQAMGAYNTDLGSYQSLSKVQQAELLGQLLTQGSLTGIFENTEMPSGPRFDETGLPTKEWDDYYSGKTKGQLGGNNISDLISGDLMKLFGSKELLYDNVLQGIAYDMSGLDPIKKTWDENWSDSHDSIWGSSKSKAWDKGISQMGRQLNNEDWWKENARSTSDGMIYLPSDKISDSPGWLNSDVYLRNQGEQETKKGMVQNIWEKTSPTHLIAGQEFKDMQPIGEAVGNFFIPGLGSLINAVDAFSTGNAGGGVQGLARAGISYGGSTYGGDVGAPVETGVSTTGTAANGMASNAGGVFGTGFSMGSTAADKALQTAMTSAAQTGVGGGDLKAVLANALLSGAGGFSGDTISKMFGTSTLGNIASGAMSGAVSSLNNPKQILESALTGGAGAGLGSLMNSTGAGKAEQRTNQNTGKQLANLARLFYKATK